MKKHIFLLFALLCLFCVISCSTEPSSSNNPVSEPNPETDLIKYSREYWGEWKKMDQSETWLINSTSISINGAESSRTVILAKPSANVISVTENGQTYCLYAVRTASSTISGSITSQENSRALEPIYKIVAQNIRDANDVTETTSDDEGNFNVDSLIVGEEYNIQIGDTALTVKPSFNGENIGNITIMNGVNFKVTLSNTNDVMYAGSQYYSMNLIIENIGDANCTAATYSLVGDDGVEVINNYADGVLLRTVAAGEKKNIPLRIRCDVPESETVIKKLNLTITDKDGTTWNDSVSLKFYRDTVTINVISEKGRPISGVIIGDGRTYSITNRANYSIEVPVTAESYMLVFSGAIANAARNTEAAYSVGVNSSATAAASLLAELGTRTNSYEPNDDENHAKPITFGKSIVSYLFENDIDYYYLEPVHLWNEGEITKEATCTENGTITYTCTVCGETTEEIIPATGHSFSAEWSKDEENHWHAATCGHEVISEKNTHSWNDVITTKQPSCSETGTKTYICAECGQTKDETIQTIPHTWGVGTVLTEATHTTDGLMRFVCTVCESTKDEVIPALVDAHSFSDKWTRDSESHWHASTCGHDVVSGKEAHSWDEGTITVEPTHSTEGLMTFVCTVCGLTKTEIIPKTGYDIGDIGPAGGYVFYDCDSDNDSGNADGLISSACGWRYLEAAPGDLWPHTGMPATDSEIQAAGFEIAYSGIESWIFGLYLNGNNQFSYVNGTPTYDSLTCTGQSIGSGIKNTNMIVKTMGNKAYSLSDLSETTTNYAAKACSELVYAGFDDWFLPSKDELDLLYRNLKLNEIGDFSESENRAMYLSSSESEDWSLNAWGQDFTTGTQYRLSKASTIYNGESFNSRVRPIRAFFLDEPQGHCFISTVTKSPTCIETGIMTYTCVSCGFSYDEIIPISDHSIIEKECAVCHEKYYSIGDTGPGGGKVFYDKGYYSDGWKYIEAWPNVFIRDGVITGELTPGYSSCHNVFHYNDGIYSTRTFINGDITYDSSNCTRTGIGEGKRNTELLVDVFGNGNNPAAIAYRFDWNGFDDWYLPSSEELELIISVLKLTNAWSSSEAYYYDSGYGNAGVLWWRATTGYSQSSGITTYYLTATNSSWDYAVIAIRYF